MFRNIAIAALAASTLASGLFAAHEHASAKAQFECSSRGMNAWLAGDDAGALRWLGESNKAAMIGRCMDGDAPVKLTAATCRTDSECEAATGISVADAMAGSAR